MVPTKSDPNSVMLRADASFTEKWWSCNEKLCFARASFGYVSPGQGTYSQVGCCESMMKGNHA